MEVKVKIVGTNPNTGLEEEVILENGMLRTSAQNISTKFRDSFETYALNVGGRWKEISKGQGDIIGVDGNSASASYLVISKSPLYKATESIIETIQYFNMPVEGSFGLHMSQRTLGQELFVEIVDTDDTLATVPDIDIANIQQTASVITVNTPTPHGLVPGKRIGIKNVPDSRFNYPSLVVASIPSPTQFTATAGPGGTIAAVTAGPYSTAGMKVYYRPTFNYSKNGVNYVFENGTATNASLYVRGDSGDTLPSGTILGNQSATVGSTSSVQLIGSVPYAYAFTSTSEFRFAIQADRIQWHGSGIDATTETTNYLVRTQVVPNTDKMYKFRLRFRNVDAFPIVDAQIVSIVKTSATTSRITFDRNINTIMTASLTLLNLYGVRDRTANVYPNITTPVAVTAIPANNQVDITHGTVSGTVSYGGFVSIANGSTIIPGVSPQTIQSASIATGFLTVVGDVAWTGFLIGDYLDLVGVRNIVDGSSLSLDGAYRVRNINTTSLELEPIGGLTIPTTLVSTNCGGGVIKRTDARFSFVRVFDYERERVEMLARPSGDTAGAAPVVLKGTGNVTGNQGTAAALGTNGANAWIVRSGAVRTIDIASAAITSTSTSSAIDVTANNGGQQFTVDTTVVSGTTPRMYSRIQESFDGGANWFNIFDLPPCVNSTDKTFITPVLPVLGTHMRYVRTLTGTTPSFTNSATRTSRPLENPKHRRQLVDRVLSLTAVAGTASTELLYIEGTKSGQVVLSLGTAATPPAVKVQVCEDIQAGGWYDVPSATVTGVASSTVASAIFSIPPSKFARLVVTIQGVTITADSYTLLLKTWE